jgi:hypothetical protein
MIAHFPAKGDSARSTHLPFGLSRGLRVPRVTQRRERRDRARHAIHRKLDLVLAPARAVHISSVQIEWG